MWLCLSYEQTSVALVTRSAHGRQTVARLPPTCHDCLCLLYGVRRCLQAGPLRSRCTTGLAEAPEAVPEARKTGRKRQQGEGSCPGHGIRAVEARLSHENDVATDTGFRAGAAVISVLCLKNVSSRCTSRRGATWHTSWHVLDSSSLSLISWSHGFPRVPFLDAWVSTCG